MQTRWTKWFGQGVFSTGWLNALISVLLGVGVYFSSGIYDVLNHGPAVMNLRTPLDVALPLVPIFVIPYDSLQPVIYASLVVFLLTRTRVFQAAAVSMILTFLVSYLFFTFLQTEVIRPALTGSDALTQMIRDVYASDHPFNDFPSLHTSTSTLMAIFWWRMDRRLGMVEGAWTALIVLSTVLVKQHYVADIFGGLAVAFGTAWVAWRWIAPALGRIAEGPHAVANSA